MHPQTSDLGVLKLGDFEWVPVMLISLDWQKVLPPARRDQRTDYRFSVRTGQNMIATWNNFVLISMRQTI